MEFGLFILFSIIIFLLSLVSYEKFRSTTLYALAIGGAVNANFFYAGNYPIFCFGIPFGIDSIIYTLFLFCVLLMFLKEGKKEGEKKGKLDTLLANIRSLSKTQGWSNEEAMKALRVPKAKREELLKLLPTT